MLKFKRSFLPGLTILFMLTACGGSEDSSTDGENTETTSMLATNVGGAVCDVDTDGDVDRLDIELISDARNTTASAADDPRDADGNGIISLLDARTCVIRCTAPRCAIVDPPPRSICDGDCFPNGVAAGDVETKNGQSSAILWARAAFTGKVVFEYGRDPEFIQGPDGAKEVDVIYFGEHKTYFKDIDPNDSTPANVNSPPAKVELTELLPGTRYHYRVCRDVCPTTFTPESEVRGIFKTPHAKGKHGLRFGVTSCFRGDMKPFVSINNVPDKRLDFFVSLGDTIYGDSGASGGLARTLPDFRKKYDLAYSKLKSADDNIFAQARASAAFYVTIDDHEVVNDWAGGALPDTQSRSKSCNGENILGIEPDRICFCDDDVDNNGEVDDPLVDPNCYLDHINETELYQDALKAWDEYNPVLPNQRYPDEGEVGDTGEDLTRGKPKLYRYRTFGNDAAIFILDTRSFRDEANTLDRWDPDRTLLGQAQLDDLKRDLLDAETNGITWKFVLVPEPIQNLGLAAAADRFEGYAYERSLILDHIETNCIANVVFISGDIHASIVNNLTYKNSALGLQRFSTAWDISTGPVAYSGQKLSAPGPTGTTITRAGEGEPREPLDLIFQTVMDARLTLNNRPLTGFGPENFVPPPLQQQNRFIPATLLQGSYVAGHSYGWSEFSIHPENQKLLVTTWGIDWYDAPLEGEYSNAKLTDLLSREPYILHRFEVLPRNGCPGCGDGICDSVTEKCGGNDSTLLQCRSDCGRCGIGELCGDNNMCQSGLCSADIAGICIFPQENGQFCTKDEGCISGICNRAGLIHTCTPRLIEGGNCARDKECQSGLVCNDVGIGQSTCEKPGSFGDRCTENNECASNTCFGGNCANAGCLVNGVSCENGNQCCSGNCLGLFNQTCRF